MAMAERVCTVTRGTPQEGIPAKLSPASRLLLMLLEEYCGFGSARKEFCWPSIGTLASRMGCSKRYVSKLLQRLIRDGYVASEARHRNDGSRTSNRYWLLETPIVAPGPRDNGDAPTSQVRETATNPSQPIEYPLREMNPCRWTENPESSDHLPAVLHDAELLQSPRKPADVSTSDSESLSLGSSPQPVERAVNSRSLNQLSSSPSPSPSFMPPRTTGQDVETSRKQQRNAHGAKPDVSNKTGETKRANRSGWNGGGIPAERFESKQEAIDRYGEALKRGWIDSSQASKHAFFATWAGIVRLYRAGDVTNPGGYLAALLIRRLITSFPTLDDEATVKRLGLMV